MKFRTISLCCALFAAIGINSAVAQGFFGQSSVNQAGEALPFSTFDTVSLEPSFFMRLPLYSTERFDLVLPNQETSFLVSAFGQVGRWEEPSLVSLALPETGRAGLSLMLKQTLAGSYLSAFLADMGLRYTGAAYGDLSAQKPASYPAGHEHNLDLRLALAYKDRPYWENLAFRLDLRSGLALGLPFTARAAQGTPVPGDRLWLAFDWSAGAALRAPVLEDWLGLALNAELGSLNPLQGAQLPLSRRHLASARGTRQLAALTAGSASVELRSRVLKGEIPYLADLELVAYADAMAAGNDLSGLIQAPAIRTGAEIQAHIYSPWSSRHDTILKLAAGFAIDPLQGLPSGFGGDNPVVLYCSLVAYEEAPIVVVPLAMSFF